MEEEDYDDDCDYYSVFLHHKNAAVDEFLLVVVCHDDVLHVEMTMMLRQTQNRIDNSTKKEMSCMFGKLVEVVT